MSGLDENTQDVTSHSGEVARSDRCAPGVFLACTPAALDKFRELRGRRRRSGELVRITVNPGAAVPEKYELQFVGQDEVHADDRVGVVDGIPFCLDLRSEQLLQGTIIDYVATMWSSGFRFHSPDRLRLMADPVAVSVLEVVSTEVAPLVTQHGGTVTLVDVRHGVVYLELGGRCQGCGMANSTVGDSVRAILLSRFPGQITDVIDTTRHAEGADPYC